MTRFHNQQSHHVSVAMETKMAQCVFFIVTLCMSRAYYHTETICVLYALSHGDSAESKSYILNSCSVLSSLFDKGSFLESTYSHTLHFSYKSYKLKKQSRRPVFVDGLPSEVILETVWAIED